MVTKECDGWAADSDWAFSKKVPDGGYAVIRLSRDVLSELAVNPRLDIIEATGGVWRLHRPTLGGLSMTMRASREINNNPFPKLYY